MVVTLFDLLWPKTLCCMQTSWLYVLQNQRYGHSKFYIAGIGIFNLFSSGDLDLDVMTFIYNS